MSGLCYYRTYVRSEGGLIDAPKMVDCVVGAAAGGVVDAPRRTYTVPQAPGGDAQVCDSQTSFQFFEFQIEFVILFLNALFCWLVIRSYFIGYGCFIVKFTDYIYRGFTI